MIASAATLVIAGSLLLVRPEGPPIQVQSDPAAGLQAGATTPSPSVIADIHVHGNHVSADADIIRIAGVGVGDPFSASTLADIRRRLVDAGRFEDVDVLKRYASIADTSRIAIVIVVNEGPVRVEMPGVPGQPARVVRRRVLTNVLFMPILDAEDGYGVTYGGRFAYAGVGGKQGRLSFPASWGGVRHAGAEFDRTFPSGVVSHVQIGSGIEQRRNPAFDETDRRLRVWARAERAAGPVRGGATVGWQRVRFADADDDLRSVGADVAYDTRVDPALPRNAVYAMASWTRWGIESGGSVDRTVVDARGYLGLVGQSVLVARVERDQASAPLPPYLQCLLGGWSNLRGFRAGAFTGDIMTTGSLELLVPLSSPLSIGKLGVSTFVDRGRAYAYGQRFSDGPFHTGVGAGVWMTMTAFQMSISAAHGRGATTRVNFSAGLSF